MKYLCLLLAVSFTSMFLLAGSSGESEGLLETLRPAVKKATSEFDQIGNERRKQLEEVAAFMRKRLDDGKTADIMTICTHNSRRSHLSQVWAQTAAYFYGLSGVTTYSGGIEVTACNYRTIRALRRAGFSAVRVTEGENPVYLIQYSENQAPIKAYSKLFHVDENPQKDFVAMFVCDHASESCPLVKEAGLRSPIFYDDPKASDGTPAEDASYDASSQRIAREMFYLMSKVSGD